MHSSDETGDEPGRTAPAGQATGEPEPGKHPAPAHAFRERIRRASVAAAQATAEPLPVEPVPMSISSLPPEASPSSNSSLPPEHSGVRDRPGNQTRPDETGPSGEAKAPLITSTPLPAGANPRRMTPRAWPFAAGTRSETRLTNTPPRDAEDAEHDLKPPSSPGAYSVTPPSGLSTLSTSSPDGASWSPGSTKPQRASLLRSHDSSGESGRYSVRDNSVDYVDAKRAPSPAGAAEVATGSSPAEPAPSPGGDAGTPPAPAPAMATAVDRSRMRTADHRLGAHSGTPDPVTRPVASPPPGAGKSFIAEEDETTSRARRYTPKQRPAQRRGRSYDRGSPGARSQERAIQERAELARTLPDIRTTLPGRPSALQASAPVSPESPTQPKGRPLSQPPRSLPPSPPPRQAQPVSASPPPGAASSKSSHDSHDVHEASIVVDPALLGMTPAAPPEPAVLSARATVRGGSFTAGTPNPNAPPVPRVEVGPEPSQIRRSAVPLARYEPLPSDPEAFERLMRERAAARGQPGARLNWNQQETLLIPRESLRAAPSGPLANRRLIWSVAAAVVLIALTATVILVRSTPAATKALRAVPLSTSTSSLALTQAESTVIASEPAGAELLQTGAVLGNTPLEVRRPKSGAISYTLRLSGYQPETVTISPSSQPTLRVVLRPAK